MKRGALLLVSLTVLLLASTGCDDGVAEAALVFGGRLEVPSASVRNGWVVVLDGTLVVAEGAALRGSVVQFGGRTRLEGRVEGDVIALVGDVALGPDAHVRGDLAVADALERDPRARVDGAVITGRAVPEGLSGLLREGPTSWRSVLGRAAVLALLGLVATRFAPRKVARLRDVVRHHWLTAAALGTLAFVVGLVLVVVMAFTVVLIPVSLVGLVVGFLALLMGWSALGIALGSALAERRFGSAAGSGWGQRLAVASGVFAVVALLGALERVPVAGALVALAATAVGVGAVLLTGFGTRRFVPDAERDVNTPITPR